MLSNSAAVQKVEQEIAEFRNFEKLSQALIAVNQQICQLRPVEEPDTPWATEEKTADAIHQEMAREIDLLL